MKLGGRSITLSYHNINNRLTRSVDTDGWGGNTGTRTIAYDARINVTILGNMAFAYDLSDQPVAVTGAANGTYTYDGNLKRVKSVVGGKTIYNIYDASGALVHIDDRGSNAKTDYVKGAGQTLARVRGGTVTYTHNDHLGSAVSGTTSAGAVAWQEKFLTLLLGPFPPIFDSPDQKLWRCHTGSKAFGITKVNHVANDNQAGYTGHICDKATGLNYMHPKGISSRASPLRAQDRYYDPVIGRFLSIDPVTFLDAGNPAMFKRYAHVENGLVTQEMSQC